MGFDRGSIDTMKWMLYMAKNTKIWKVNTRLRNGLEVTRQIRPFVSFLVFLKHEVGDPFKNLVMFARVTHPIFWAVFYEE